MLNPLYIEEVLRVTDRDRYGYRSYRAFILLWILFEAWITDLSGKERVAEKFNWFKQNKNILKDSWHDSNAAKDVLVLSTNWTIYDKKPNSSGKTITISEPMNPDLNEVVDLLYQIRNNLFHGHEDITKNENITMYQVSATILRKWLNWAYLQASKI